MLSFFAGMKGKLLILGGATVLGFGAGVKVTSNHYDAKTLKLMKEIEEVRERIASEQFEVERLTAENVRLVEENSNAVTREVIRYVNTGYMAAEWVRIHDCQVRSTGEAACGPDAPTSGTITDGDALGVVTKNYSDCQKAFVRYEGLQRWVEAMYGHNP